MAMINYDAFLSYNSQDREFAERLAKYLRDRAALIVWFDMWIPPGRSWDIEVETGLYRSKTILVLIGNERVGEWVQRELIFALSESKKVIPILLGGANPKNIPIILSNLPWIDLRSEWENISLQTLVDGIRGAPLPKMRFPKVFLCHAMEDSKRVEDLSNLLQDEGLDPWFDKEDLLIGDRWEDEIYKAIEKSDFFAICLSKTSVNKTGFIQKEIRTAVNEYQRRPQDVAYLIPLKLETCDIPKIKLDSNTRLTDLQWIDVFENDINAVKRLAIGIWKQWEKTEKSRAT